MLVANGVLLWVQPDLGLGVYYGLLGGAIVPMIIAAACCPTYNQARALGTEYDLIPDPKDAFEV